VSPWVRLSLTLVSCRAWPHPPIHDERVISAPMPVAHLSTSSMDRDAPQGSPAGSVAITAGFEFDVPVRFDTDALDVTLDLERLGSITSIPLLESHDSVRSVLHSLSLILLHGGCESPLRNSDLSSGALRKRAHLSVPWRWQTTATATRRSASAPSGCASRVLRLCSPRRRWTRGSKFWRGSNSGHWQDVEKFDRTEFDEVRPNRDEGPFRARNGLGAQSQRFAWGRQSP
jgi:hypothetical protein